MSYIFGGNTGIAYGDAQKQREMAQQLRKKPPENPALTGLNNGLDAIGDAITGRKDAWKAYDAGTGEKPSDSFLGGMFDGWRNKGEPLDSYLPKEKPFQAQADAREATGTNIGTMTQGDLDLVYYNQGRIRDKPLSDDLVASLSAFAPQMGMRVLVESGGQTHERDPARYNKPGGWKGSTRHNHGNAGDVQFQDIATGRILSMDNPDDIPRLAEIVQAGKSAGLTGFGMANDYMGPTTMHVGYGGSAVWGRKDTIPQEWLYDAYHGAGAWRRRYGRG